MNEDTNDCLRELLALLGPAESLLDHFAQLHQCPAVNLRLLSCGFLRTWCINFAALLSEIDLHADLHEHLDNCVHEFNRVELLSNNFFGLWLEERPRYLNRKLLESRLELAASCICCHIFTALEQVVDETDLEFGDLLRAVLVLEEFRHGHIEADLLGTERHRG